MDQEGKALINAVVHEAAAPFTGVISDLVGISGGDALKAFRAKKQERREQNEREILDAAGRALKARGKNPDPNASPEHLEEILDTARDCGTPELRELFSRLLASALDPDRSKLYRQEFVAILKQMEPIDALVFPELFDRASLAPNKVSNFSSRFQRDTFEIENSFKALFRLGLTNQETGLTPETPRLNSLGQQLLALLR